MMQEARQTVMRMVHLRSYSGSDLAAILGENSVAASSASEAKSPEEGARRLVVDLRESMPNLQGGAQASFWPAFLQCDS